MKIAFPTQAQISATYNDAKAWVKANPVKATVAALGAALIAPAIVFRKEIQNLASRAITAVLANLPSATKAAVVAASSLPATGKGLVQEQTSTTALETIYTELTDLVSETTNANLDAPIAMLNDAETAVEAAIATAAETVANTVVAAATTVAEAAPKA